MMTRARSFPVVSPLLLLLFAFTTGATLGADQAKPAAAAAQPADALWRFNTHG